MASEGLQRPPLLFKDSCLWKNNVSSYYLVGGSSQEDFMLLHKPSAVPAFTFASWVLLVYNEGLLCVCGLCNVRERTEPRLSFQGFLSQLHCYSILYRSSRRKQMLITPRDALQLRRLEKAGLEKGLWFGLEDRETKGGTHICCLNNAWDYYYHVFGMKFVRGFLFCFSVKAHPWLSFLACLTMVDIHGI